MKFGLTDQEFSNFSEKFLNPLKMLGSKVYIFGSRATGRQKRFSDIDIVYEPVNENDFSEAKVYLLLEVMENSNFPYKVDLVKKSEMASSYKENFEKQKIEI